MVQDGNLSSALLKVSTGTYIEVGAVLVASSCLCQSDLSHSKVSKRYFYQVWALWVCLVFFCENILIFHALLPHYILLVFWFLMVQPGILLILMVLSLKLLPQQLQLSLLCQEMIQLQVGWCLCSFY